MKKHQLFMLLASMLLVGCGQKGPLTLPKKETPKSSIQVYTKGNLSQVSDDITVC